MIKKTGDEESVICCPLCGSPGLSVFYEMFDVPANCNLLWRTKDEAIHCPKGNIKLAFCPSCSFITNVALDPKRNQYGDRYEDSLFYSTSFQIFATKLVAKLIKKYSLKKKNILEIGSGKVNFMPLLIEIGDNRGLRYNTLISRIDSEDANLPKNKQEINFVFSYCELEHMNSPKIFLKELQKMFHYSDDAHFFFSVPNALKDLKDGNFSNIIYEHVSYFTPLSLAYAFSQSGFNVEEATESKNEIFDYIYVDATCGKSIAPKFPEKTNISKIEQYVKNFRSRTTNYVDKNKTLVKQLLDGGKIVVLWGAGSRGVTILNILKDPRIEYAVDINPNKQGMHVPGTGQTIIEPNYLLNIKPDYIILTNGVYRKEIGHLLEKLEIESKFLIF